MALDRLPFVCGVGILEPAVNVGQSEQIRRAKLGGGAVARLGNFKKTQCDRLTNSQGDRGPSNACASKLPIGANERPVLRPAMLHMFKFEAV